MGEDALRGRIAGGGGVDDHPAAECSICRHNAKANQQPPDREASALCNHSCPAVAMPKPLAIGLDRRVRIVGIEARPQVADLRGDPVAAPVDAAVDHQGPADAAADGDIEDHAVPAAGAEKGLGQPGGVGVVGNGGGQAESLAAPSGQGEVGPAFHLMAGDRAAFLRIDRTAETNADGRRAVALDQFAADGLDLPKDAAGLFFRADVGAAEFNERRAVARPTASCSFVPPISMPRNMVISLPRAFPGSSAARLA